MSSHDTIYALASAAGRAGVAVVRVSGADAVKGFELCKPKKTSVPRRATMRVLHDPANGELIDKALLLWFPAPHSFTGENIVEFHIHGGRAILHKLISCFARLGFRLAEPGEFSRRAYENDKFDLTEAEAIADLVDAETEAQRRQAMRQFEGGLGRMFEDWRARLAKILAYLEAGIDFSDEELPADMEAQQTKIIQTLATEIAQHLDDKYRGERLRDGFSVAILGPPNAGKSSLLNSLAKREAAIVSSIAGTTRDVIEAHLDLGGYPVILADTAGLRDSADIIESEGVRRALERAEKSDLKLLVFDGEHWPKLDAATQKLSDENAIVVVNKADLIELPRTLTPDPRPLFISAQTGEGIAGLFDHLIKEIERRFGVSAAPVLTRARHRVALKECQDHLQRALASKAAELRAEDIRLAMRALGRVTGRVDVEDLLDIIFRDFCIGK